LINEIKFLNGSSIAAWASHVAKAIYGVVIMTMSTLYFSSDHNLIWQFILSAWGAYILFDAGFQVTYTRLFAYKLYGKPLLSAWDTSHVSDLLFLSRRTYKLIIQLFIIVFLIVAIFILDLDKLYTEEFIALFLSMISISIFIWISTYKNYLIGSGFIKEVKQIESLMYFLMATLGAAGIYFGIVYLSLSFFISVLFFAIILFKIAKKSILNNSLITPKKINLNLWHEVKSKVYKSAMGAWLNLGSIYVFIYTLASNLDTETSASLLLCLNLIRFISQFSQVPFYTIIPKISALHNNNKLDEFRLHSSSTIFFSLCIFSTLVVAVSLIILYLPHFNSVVLLNEKWWVLFAVGYFLDRDTTMLSHVAMASDKIINHIIGFTFSSIFLPIGLVLFYYYGVLSLPYALIISNLLFGTWYSRYKTASLIGVSKLNFIPLILLIFYGYLI
jgi:hypothetical protein